MAAPVSLGWVPLLTRRVTGLRGSKPFWAKECRSALVASTRSAKFSRSAAGSPRTHGRNLAIATSRNHTAYGWDSAATTSAASDSPAGRVARNSRNWARTRTS